MTSSAILCCTRLQRGPSVAYADGWTHQDVEYLIEVPGYDGWSLAMLKSGVLVNRWEKDDTRYLPAKRYAQSMGLEVRDDNY